MRASRLVSVGLGLAAMTGATSVAAAHPRARGAAANTVLHACRGKGGAPARLVIAHKRCTGGEVSWSAAGIPGPPGAPGQQGPQGPRGVAGAVGAPGAPGAGGVPGAAGKAGQTGATGATGLAGSAGAKGAAGVTGATGASGATGGAGPGGTKGATGAKGVTGPEGSGATGPTGPAGATGPALPGPMGPTGAFATTLPSGESEHGTWVVGNASVREEEPGPTAGAISFPVPLSKAPAHVELLLPGKTTSNCSGSAEAPSAARGYLCAYTGQERREGGAGSIVNLAGAPGASATGAFVVFTLPPGLAVEAVLVEGAWAVTAE